MLNSSELLAVSSAPCSLARFSRVLLAPDSGTLSHIAVYEFCSMTRETGDDWAHVLNKDCGNGSETEASQRTTDLGTSSTKVEDLGAKPELAAEPAGAETAGVAAPATGLVGMAASEVVVAGTAEGDELNLGDVGDGGTLGFTSSVGGRNHKLRRVGDGSHGLSGAAGNNCWSGSDRGGLRRSGDSGDVGDLRNSGTDGVEGSCLDCARCWAVGNVRSARGDGSHNRRVDGQCLGSCGCRSHGSGRGHHSIGRGRLGRDNGLGLSRNGSRDGALDGDLRRHVEQRVLKKREQRRSRKRLVQYLSLLGPAEGAGVVSAGETKQHRRKRLKQHLKKQQPKWSERARSPEQRRQGWIRKEPQQQMKQHQSRHPKKQREQSRREKSPEQRST
ncbi:hypothetical protein KCV07_g180, partial [Aureobasidium melanogenum]